jgi:hypothetical protein
MTRRRLFTVASAISLVLCVATIGLWVRSHMGEAFVRGGRLFMLYMEPQDLADFVYLNHFTDADDGQTRARIAKEMSDPGLVWDHLRRAGVDSAAWNRLGIEYHRGRYSMSVFGSVTRTYALPYRLIAVSLRTPIAAFAILPIAWLAARSIRSIRAKHRARHRRCVVCRYDLRASTGRCPECGTPIPTESAI